MASVRLVPKLQAGSSLPTAIEQPAAQAVPPPFPLFVRDDVQHRDLYFTFSQLEHIQAYVEVTGAYSKEENNKKGWSTQSLETLYGSVSSGIGYAMDAVKMELIKAKDAGGVEHSDKGLEKWNKSGLGTGESKMKRYEHVERDPENKWPPWLGICFVEADGEPYFWEYSQLKGILDWFSARHLFVDLQANRSGHKTQSIKFHFERLSRGVERARTEIQTRARETGADEAKATKDVSETDVLPAAAAVAPPPAIPPVVAAGAADGGEPAAKKPRLEITAAKAAPPKAASAKVVAKKSAPKKHASLVDDEAVAEEDHGAAHDDIHLGAS